MNDDFAGILEEDAIGFIFTYDSNFLKVGIPISFSLPLHRESFRSKELFYFFEGLLPEGWTLDIYSSVLKVDKNDKFGMLLATCHDCIGAVTVKEIE
jgi:serine/threonine-protein kinase HipA